MRSKKLSIFCRLIRHIQKNYLVAPPERHLPYKLDEPDKADYSQFGQTEIVRKLLENKVCRRFFIECGAFDGEIGSNSLSLEKYYGWTGLLIEPTPSLMKSLRSKIRKAWTIQACLHVRMVNQT